MGYMQALEQRSLTREQKEAVGLLSIGTFLEFFDLMLYVHMIILLNELFFPPTDPFITSLLSAATFSSTFILLPIGSLFFGYLGDKFGRKKIVMLSTAIMSLSCILIANLPTYAQIGITASIILTVCRVVQSMSCAAEFTGASLYLTELIPYPNKYWVVALIGLISAVGGLAALAIASLVYSIGFNWRAAFGMGAVVAVIGLFARTLLKETREYVDAKKRLANVTKDSSILNKYYSQNKTNKKTILGYFGIEATWPVVFYLVYIHFAHVLKNQYGYSSEMIIKHNFYLTILLTVQAAFFVYLVSKINPIILCKIKAFLFAVFTLCMPFLCNSINSSEDVILLQVVMLLIYPSSFTIIPVIYSHFPVLKRFTYTATIYSTAKAVMYCITSFGIVLCLDSCGNYGLYIILLPIALLYIVSINHFSDLEKEAGRNYSFLLKNYNNLN